MECYRGQEPYHLLSLLPLALGHQLLPLLRQKLLPGFGPYELKKWASKSLMEQEP